jgi:hypothetical protein
MLIAINDVCDEPGDDIESRLALIDECSSRSHSKQADILDHFAQVARAWHRANQGLAVKITGGERVLLTLSNLTGAPCDCATKTI